MSKPLKNRFLRRMIYLIPALVTVLLCLGIGAICLLPVEQVDDWLNAPARRKYTPMAEEYLREQYPDNDFYITDFWESFKENAYVLSIQSRSSPDTHFLLYYNQYTDELDWNTYDTDVADRNNVLDRIEQEYTALTLEVLNSMEGFSQMDARFRVYSTGQRNCYYSPEGLDSRSLELDHPYDCAAMGSQYGILELQFLDKPENIHIHRALELLQEADRQLTEQDIGWYAMEITLLDQKYPDTTTKFHIYQVTKEDLRSEDPLSRLQELWTEQEARRQALKDQWASAGE